MDGPVFNVILVLAALGVLAWLVGRAVHDSRMKARVVVDETQVGLRIVDGTVAEVLKAGVYSTWLTHDRIELVDVREQSLQVNGQEVLTRDLMPVKFALLARYRIVDARLHRSAHAYPASRMHEDLQLELRRRVAAATLDHVMTERDKVMAGFAEAIAPGLRAMGVEISDVQVRDMTLVGPARQAYADIWKAQKEGQAALERARGEQASLRSLANAARMLKGNPELMNLRVLQAIQGGPGRTPPTIVLGGASGLLPVSSDPSGDLPQDEG